MATVAINVAAVNDAPVAVNDSYNATEDTPLTIAAPGVLGNDTDVDSDPLTYLLTNSPNKGSVSVNPTTGAFTYTPNTGATGADSFKFRVNDGVANSAIVTISITIQ